jgi:hypothetical protein
VIERGNDALEIVALAVLQAREYILEGRSERPPYDFRALKVIE